MNNTWWLNIEKIIPSHFPLYIGVAENKFVAYLAAISANNRGVFKSPSNASVFVSKFPIELLPIDLSIKTRLHNFGLHTLGDISKLALNEMQAQFPNEELLSEWVWNDRNGVWMI